MRRVSPINPASKACSLLTRRKASPQMHPATAQVPTQTVRTPPELNRLYRSSVTHKGSRCMMAARSKALSRTIHRPAPPAQSTRPFRSSPMSKSSITARRAAVTATGTALITAKRQTATNCLLMPGQAGTIHLLTQGLWNKQMATAGASLGDHGTSLNLHLRSTTTGSARRLMMRDVRQRRRKQANTFSPP